MPTSRFTNLRSAIRNRVLSLVTRERQDLQESVEFVVGETKLGIGSLRSIHSLRASKLTDLKKLLGPSTFFSAIPDLVIQRRNISLMARIFSIPSVSGPSFQVCSYQVDLALLGPMSACNSKCILGQYRPSKDMISKHGKHLKSKNMISLNSFEKTSMGLNGRCGSENSAIHGYLMYDVAKRCSNLYPLSGWGIRFLHGPLSSCFSAGAATDVSCESSAHDEQIKSWGEASESQVSAENPLKLLSGSCYLPHPDKEETGGEDAHFICKDEQAVGVADGVGGWADLGVDSGYYSRELMSNSVKSIQEEPKGCIDPARVLEKAHSCTTAKGSSTACIIALTDKGLHAVNLGDSGFIVIRNGSTVFRSPVQQHNFNFTYQLESGNNGDLPSSGQVFTVAVLPGDIIIAGTDGLFDNLYNNEITAVVVQTKRAGLGPEVTAQKIAALARQRAVDKNRQTPFSTAAQDAGFRYYGGKLDDITVVVSYVTGSD